MIVNRKYDDIIDLPHHRSQSRPAMSRMDRAAQFSPFSALVGYEEVIEERGRLTQREQVLGEDAEVLLDRKLRFLRENLQTAPPVSICYFLPDLRKEGGDYVRKKGQVTELRGEKGYLILEGGGRIPIKQICELEFI